MKRRAFTWIEALVVIATIAIIAAILFPAFVRSKENAHKSSCPSNLKQVGLGFMQYLQDYDEEWPTVSLGETPYGWADGLQPYLKSTYIFQCPTEGNSSGENPKQNSYTDYWYNARIAGVTEKKIKNAASTIILGDGNDGQDNTDARYSLSTLPASWIADKSSPAYRHGEEGAYYAFADGHVKFLKPEKISDSPANKTAPTFRVR